MAADKTESVHSIEREMRLLLHRVRRRSLDNARMIHPDLQPAAYSILMFVVDHAPTRASDIVEKLGVDKGSVSRQVAALEKLGLVERHCDELDHRAQTLTVSPATRATITEIGTRRRTDFVARLSTWSAADLESFAEQLGRYNASLDGSGPKTHP
jgi:DNA-binding MarR family transcriptional regulator